MRFTSILSVCLLAAISGGCVSQTVFDEKVAEVHLLKQTVSGVEEEYDRLLQQKKEVDGQNLDLIGRLKEAHEQTAALQKDLVRARADIDRLEKVLSARSAEAGAAMAEMRQTIDRLTDQTHTLEQQIENERIARDARMAHIKTTYDELVEQMEDEIRKGEITISDLKGKLTVNMVESILFDSGKADIKPEGQAVLKRVGDILRNVSDKEIRVEGHTDNVPISSRLRDRFPTNWELSAARAINVVHFLQKKIRIPGNMLSASGLGQYRPIADNATAEGRAQNRRIQIVLVPLDTIEN